MGLQMSVPSILFSHGCVHYFHNGHFQKVKVEHVSQKQIMRRFNLDSI